MVKSVFLSFASDNYSWVRQFKSTEAFAGPLELARVYDYKVPGEARAFGPLDDWLRDKVNECAAVFAFISAAYLESHASKVEFELALERLRSGRVIFVPVLLDVDAKAFWRDELKANDRYSDIIAGYMYADFSNGIRPRNIFLENSHDNLDVTDNIRCIAKEVARKLGLAKAPPSREVPPDAIRLGAAKAEPPPADHRERKLVLLGDPRSSTPEKQIAESYDALSNGLTGVLHKRWPHAWRLAPADDDEKVEPPATFLRLVSSLDIEDAANAPETLKWINASGRVSGKVEGDVILWRPGDDRFFWPEKSPTLGEGSAEALASWLAREFGAAVGDEAPLLLIIDEPNYDAVEDAPYSDVVRMVWELTNEKFPGRAMNAESFRQFVAEDRHRKLIIAVLDNNVSLIAQDGCKPIEQFEQLVERWQDELADINKEKEDQDPTLKVETVWVAVMARLAHLHRSSTWNKRTLEPIHVLRVFRSTGPAGQPQYAADADSATQVAKSLKRFMRPPP